MKVVYIAGKYRAPTPWGVEQNIQAAREVASKVVAAGYMPLCPHTNTAHMEGLADDAFFLAGTLELLRRCDAVLCVSNWRDSAGARAEVEEARRLQVPVFGVGSEFADPWGRDGDAPQFAMTMDAAVENLCEWARYDDKIEARWHGVAVMPSTSPTNDLFAPVAFQRKHGTAERWNVCDCDECREGLKASNLPA